MVILKFIFMLLSLIFWAQVQASTTVLIYWAVDNDLYHYSKSFLEDFKKIPPAKHLNLVLFYDTPDGARTYHLNQNTEDPSVPLEIKGARSLKNLGKTDSANHLTLKNFIHESKLEFPSDKTILVIGTHGSNWSGVIEDLSHNHYMSLDDFGLATKDLKLDLLIFDACRMAYVETLLKLKTKYQMMLASTFDVNGFNHTPALEKLAKEEHHPWEDVIKTYVESYFLRVENQEAIPHAVSLIDNSRESQLLKLNELFFSQVLTQKTNSIKDWHNQLLKSINEDGDESYDLEFMYKQALINLSLDQKLIKNLLEELYTLVPLAIANPYAKNLNRLAITCPKDLAKYKETMPEEELISWIKLCAQFKELRLGPLL